MAQDYHLDFETYSAADLRSFGAYRYASDETTEILIMAIAAGDSKPLVWSTTGSASDNHLAVAFLKKAIDEGSTIYAHNAQFEAAICKYLLKKTFGFDAPKLEQWRCTAAMARRAAIPSSLSGAGEFLGIEKAKDKAGAALIRKFSIPRRPTKKDARKRIMPADEPEAFAAFVDYCKQDVEAEREIHQCLKAFEITGPVLQSFQFDLKMNDRGVPVNVPALARVNAMIDEYTERLTEEFKAITGFTPGQRAKVLEWANARGYPFDNLQSAQVDRVLSNGPSGWVARYVKHNTPEGTRPTDQPVVLEPIAFKALEIRSKVSFAAVKKVPTMLGAACPDNMVRGSLLWSGAERTHRWAGRIIQPQNFRRPTIKGTEEAYRMLCEGADIDTIEMFFGPFLEVVASCIRHFIHWTGGDLLQADYSSVEGRAAPWLCGGEAKLELFRKGEPIYEHMAARIFNVPVLQIVAEHKAGNSDKRFIGKQAELGANYNMGWPKFRGTCEGFNYKPSTQMVEDFKPRFKKQLAQLQRSAQLPQEWDEREKKFPPFHWAQLRNQAKQGKFARRMFTVWAYRPDGTKRSVQPNNITPQEWVDLCYDDLAFKAITAWRKSNPEIVAAWRSLDTAAKDALRNPGKIFKGTDKISFGVTEKPGFRALVLKLPSGHTLIYPKAKLVWKGEEGVAVNWDDNYNTEIQFWGKIPVKNSWGWCKTYGGKLLENATQGVCGDFMGHGAATAQKHGYEAFMLVHDELVGPQHEGQDHQTLCKHLCNLPAWAKGMPLDAEGETIPFYKK